MSFRHLSVGLFVASFAFMSILIVPAEAQRKPAIEDNDLIAAARAGDLAAMVAAMDSGINVNDRGRDRVPPIVVAADAGQLKAVQLLIQKGADVNLRSGEGQTALAAAVARGHPAIVKVLLQNDANPNRPGFGSEVPLITAARLGDEMMVRLLLSVDADLDETDRTGRTALDWARENRFHSIQERLLAKRN
jgi:uncharacterized protein